jgi:hypothetical protein
MIDRSVPPRAVAMNSIRIKWIATQVESSKLVLNRIVIQLFCVQINNLIIISQKRFMSVMVQKQSSICKIKEKKKARPA